MNTKRIVITGGPGTGKTSIIEALKTNNVHCFDEIIRTLTLEAKKEGDSSTHISNPIAFVNDPKMFNTNLINGRIEQFLQANILEKELCFFDRGIPDVLAYMDFFNQDYGIDFISPCKAHKYDMVFLLPPWKAIYKSDNERFETYEEAVQIHNHLTEIYKDFGYSIIEVPFDTVGARTDFILKSVEQN